MESATTLLLQSKYFSPVFNTAIFDGPVRVYFSQHQEQEALKLYFRIQKKLKEGGEAESQNSSTLFVMLYPNEETFNDTFDSGEETVVETLGEDVVMGIKGPYKEDMIEEIEARIDDMDFIES